MNARVTAVRSGGNPQQFPCIAPAGHGRVYATSLPTTRLLEGALPNVDWADAYAVHIPSGVPYHDPQEWADAVFHHAPASIRGLLGAREAVARLVGIQRGGDNVFATVSWRPDEVLLGSDHADFSFRASVLVEADRVVLSTVVQLLNRRGRAYSALVRRIHPWMMRDMLALAAREMAVAS